MPNSKSQARTKASKRTNVDDFSFSQHSRKPNVVCRLFSSTHKCIVFMYRSTLVSQFFILLYMFTKVYAFAVIVYIIFPFAVINGFYILFISPIRLFKLSLITSIPKSVRKAFTTSKKSSCSSSCRSIIKPVSK